MISAKRALRDPLPLLAALIGLLLVGLALLQHRWLAAVSDAERARMKASAAARAEALARDLDRELTRAFLMLGLDPEAVRRGDLSSYAATYAAWRASAAYPDLVAEVWLLDGDAPADAAAPMRFDPAAGRFAASAVPQDMAPLFARLRRPESRERPAAATIDSVEPSVPALLVPAPRRMPAPPPEGEARRDVADHVFAFRSDWEPSMWTVIRLDRQALLTRILPDLARRHASAADGPEYHVTITGPVSDADAQGMVWRSDPAAPASAVGADASTRAFSVRLDDIDTAILPRLIEERRQAGASGAGATPHRVFALRIATGPAGAPRAAAAWTIALTHRAGSVDAAVANAQRRSGAVAGGVLLLLAGSAALVVASARRERRLAARELEFVAAVSHELRTPLTVIRSAAENLRDGLVVDPARVREYGGVLREEGRRLTDMVEQVLAFAGASVPERRRPVEVEALLRAAAAEARLEAAGIAVTVDVERGLCIAGDEAMLAAAVRNLLANLRKYAAGGGLARLAAHRAGDAAEIVVEDRGPGVAPDEVRRLFEPFFRGRSASESQAPGSGIGLALVRRIVEAHGGRVEARPLARGMAFVLRLPAAPTADAVPAAASPARGAAG